MQRDRSDPVLSKVARFESYVARGIVGQSQSTIDLARCIREEQMVMVSLAKGVVGEEIAHLLEATILSLVHLVPRTRNIHQQLVKGKGAKEAFVLRDHSRREQRAIGSILTTSPILSLFLTHPENKQLRGCLLCVFLVYSQ